DHAGARIARARAQRLNAAAGARVMRITMADTRSLLFTFVATLALAAAAPAHAASPLFRVDPFWPKPLPNNWILGQVGGMAVDDHDNIWVFQRPRSLTDDEKG